MIELYHINTVKF